jgi:putative transposase
MKTLKQHIRKLSKDEFIELKRMCKHSNSLYNSALYIVNQYYEQTNSYIGYTKLYHEIKTNIHYTSIPTKISQQILRLVDKNYMSFFSLLKQKAKGQYTDKVNKPKYKKPNQEFILVLPSDQVSLKNNKLKITKKLKLNFNYEINGKIKQVIIKPNNYGYYTILIQYEELKTNLEKLNQNNVLGIDLGLDNLATCVSNVGHSFIVNGKPLKSYNKFYNKRKADIQSELKKCNNKHYSKKLSNLDVKRDNYVNNYFNQTINKIIKYCLKNNIGNVVIGYNESWKSEINMGKKTNQSFVNIPHRLFKLKLESKCNENNINFHLTEESYTSKASFLNSDPLPTYGDNCDNITFSGYRKNRGLYKIKGENKTINADVNGACNIIRKVFPEFNHKGIEGFIVTPMVLNVI